MAATEIFSSFYTNIQDRLKNPFYGAFIISWLGWNWKFITLLLYGDPTYDKIITHICGTGSLVLFWFPFLFAALFVFGGPWLTLYIQKGKNRITLKSKEYIFNQHKIILESKNELLTLQAENKFIADRVKLEYDKDKAELTKKENEAKLEEEFKKIEVGKVGLEIERKKLLEKEEGLVMVERNLENSNDKIVELENELRLLNEKLASPIEEDLSKLNTENMKFVDDEQVVSYALTRIIKEKMIANQVSQKKLSELTNMYEPTIAEVLSGGRPMTLNLFKILIKNLPIESEFENNRNRITEFKSYLENKSIHQELLEEIVGETKSNISKILKEEIVLSENELASWYKRIDSYLMKNKN